MFHPELGPQQDSNKLTMTKVVVLTLPSTNFIILATESSCNETCKRQKLHRPCNHYSLTRTYFKKGRAADRSYGKNHICRMKRSSARGRVGHPYLPRDDRQTVSQQRLKKQAKATELAGQTKMKRELDR